MDKSIFREKSVESISSPDSLNDYIRVVSPSLWVTLAAIIALLIGVSIWSVVGHLDSVVNIAVSVSDGQITGYVNESDAMDALDGQFVVINGKDYSFSTDSFTKETLSVSNDSMILKTLGDDEDSEVRSFSIDGELADGLYSGTIVVSSVKPISFVTN